MTEANRTEEQVFICPTCNSNDGVRDEADIGVGVQYGPWHCQECGWNESTACPICGKEDCHCNYEDGLL